MSTDRADAMVRTELQPEPGTRVEGGALYPRAVSVRNLIAPMLAMYGGQLMIGLVPKQQHWGIVIVAGGLLLLVLRVQKRRPALAHIPADALQITLGLLLGLPLALNADGMKLWTPAEQSILVWLLSCALVVLAVLNFDSREIRLGLPPLKRGDRWDILVLVLLILGTAVLRFGNLATIPLGFDPDEGSFGTFAVDAAMGLAKDPFATGWATHPTLQFFLNGALVRLFGRTFTVMRLPSAIMGTLAVVAIYVLARVGYGRKVAILAGVLAMGSDVLIQFSRLGINNISDALFMTWTLAALWIAGQSGRPGAYVMAGIGLALGQYYYFGARAIPFVVAATLVIWLIADWRGFLRSWCLILGLLVVVLVVMEPLLGHWLRNSGSISEHMFLTLPFSKHLQEQTARLNLAVPLFIWRQIRDSLLVFTVLPDRGSFYHPKQAMVHPALAPFFLIGLLVTFTRWRRPSNQGVLVWIAVVLTLGSVLLNDPATFHRLLGLVPAVIVLTAIGIDEAALAVSQAIRWPSSARDLTKLAGVAMAFVAAGLLAATTVNYYFRIYNVREPFKPPVQEAVSVAALEYVQLDGQGIFLLCGREGVDANSGKIYHTPIVYAAGQNFKGCTPQAVAQAKDVRPVYFYVLPDQQDKLPLLRAEFPGGTLKDYQRRSDGLKIMTRYAVAASSKE